MVARHLAVVCREDHDRIFPEIQFIQAIQQLLETGIRVTDHIQVVVIEHAPHIGTVHRNGAESPDQPMW